MLLVKPSNFEFWKQSSENPIKTYQNGGGGGGGTNLSEINKK